VLGVTGNVKIPSLGTRVTCVHIRKMDRAFGLGEVDGAALIDERAGRDKVLGEGGREQCRAGQM